MVKLVSNAGAWMFLLAVLCSAARAQDGAVGSGDVRIKMGAGAPVYCLGPRQGTPYMAPAEDPDDLTLRLPLKVRYDNFSSETVILPDFAAWITRMSVEGQEGATILRNARVPGLVNIERVRAMSAPDETRDFYILPPGGDAGPVLSVMETDSYSRWQEAVAVPVVHGASGIDLRGRMIEITMTRDHRSLPPDLVTTLNERWPDYGTVWIGIVESQSMRFWIPPEPLALDCTTP